MTGKYRARAGNLGLQVQSNLQYTGLCVEMGRKPGRSTAEISLRQSCWIAKSRQ